MNTTHLARNHVDELTAAVEFLINGMTTDELEQLVSDIRSKQSSISDDGGKIERDSYNGLIILEVIIQSTINLRHGLQTL